MFKIHGLNFGASLGLAALLSLPGLSACEVAADLDSQAACGQFCSKKSACASEEPTTEESNTCIAACREDIENNCGNDDQAEANAQIKECVDLSCTEFATCMVFEAAPACFGFATN